MRYHNPVAIHFGAGAIAQLPAILGGRRAVLVIFPEAEALGLTARMRSLLGPALAAVEDRIEPNPDVANLASMYEAFWRDHAAVEAVIAVGGGSAIDTAKALMVGTASGRFDDLVALLAKGAAFKPHRVKALIAVPTTAGTGSETQSFALISDEHTHVKMACGDKKASFRIAILDPTLTVTLPAKITAVTGIDAIAHALETYVTTKRNAASLAFSREAWQLLESNFARVLEHPDDLVARGEMQLGACFAGLAIENSMLGATHALANPLTAEYGIPHGEAIGLLLAHVIRYNGQEYEHWYHELLETTFGSNGDHRHGRAGRLGYAEPLK